MINYLSYKFYTFLLKKKQQYELSKIYYLGKRVNIAASTVIVNPEKCSIGEHTMIADYTVILAGNQVSIGKSCFISTSCMITSVTHKIASYNRHADGAISLKKNLGVAIGDNVWIGANCVIQPGSVIGNNSIVAAGAVLKGIVPENEIWGGNPAQFIAKIDFPINLYKTEK